MAYWPHILVVGLLMSTVPVFVQAQTGGAAGASVTADVSEQNITNILISTDPVNLADTVANLIEQYPDKAEFITKQAVELVKDDVSLVSSIVTAAVTAKPDSAAAITSAAISAAPNATTGINNAAADAIVALSQEIEQSAESAGDQAGSAQSGSESNLNNVQLEVNNIYQNLLVGLSQCGSDQACIAAANNDAQKLLNTYIPAGTPTSEPEEAQKNPDVTASPS